MRNQSIDFNRFLLSIGIIAIHAGAFKTCTPLYSSLTMGLFRIGVPFFFITAGYYYHQKIMQNRETTSYLLKLVKLYLKFTLMTILLYVPLVFFYFNQSNVTSASLAAPAQPVGVLIFRTITAGINPSYWYLTSSLLSLLILTPLWKRKCDLPPVIIGAMLYLVMLTNDSYSFLTLGLIQHLAKLHTELWMWPQAGLCSSLLFIGLGGLISRYESEIKVSMPLLCGLIALLIVEACWTQSHHPADGNGYLTMIVAAPVYFLYLLQHPHLPFQTDTLGQMSLYIYLLHHPFITYGSMLTDNRELIWLTVSFLVILISAIIVTHQNKQKNLPLS